MIRLMFASSSWYVFQIVVVVVFFRRRRKLYNKSLNDWSRGNFETKFTVTRGTRVELNLLECFFFLYYLNKIKTKRIAQ